VPWRQDLDRRAWITGSAEMTLQFQAFLFRSIRYIASIILLTLTAQAVQARLLIHRTPDAGRRR
jgi:hypothetical protein